MSDDIRQGNFSRRDFIKGAAVAAGATMLANGETTGVARAGAAGFDNSRRNDDGRNSCDGSQDLALVNGKFLTMDGNNSVVSAVAIRNGLIAEIGRAHELGSCAQIINLNGATVIPGLIDSHVHFIRAGLNPGHEVRIIETATSIADLQQMISNRAQTVPAGDFITCIGGWNRNGFAEARLPTPAELDAAAPQNPVYLSETGGGGAAVTNTSGIAFFQSNAVTVDASTGILNANQGLAALQAVQTDDDRQRGTEEVMDFASSLGLTMIHDHGGLSGLAPYDFALNLWREGNLKVRQRPFFWSGDDPGISIGEARIVNNFNRLGDDFWRPIGVGERLNTSTTNPLFVDICKFAASNGWTLTQHSLTLAENQFHVAAYQQAATAGPIDKLRWSLCHVNPITDDLIAAVVQLGIAINIQGTPYTSAAGAAPAGPPFRKLLDAGIPAGGGSDATNVAALNPWLMMFYMTTGMNNAGIVLNPGQTISRLEALRLYTIGSAYLSFDEDRLGSIETGKIADLVVLSDDPLAVSDDQFRRLSSVLTIQAGKIIHGDASSTSRTRDVSRRS
jgi:predicted amidohydrolase YtcJ